MFIAYIIGVIIAWVIGTMAIIQTHNGKDITGEAIVMFLIGFLSWVIVIFYIILLIIDKYRKVGLK